MKIEITPQNSQAVQAFLKKWIDEKSPSAGLLLLEECPPIYFDCDAAELANCFMELERVGFTQSVKHIFQGDHFYRSDTGKCPRCYRYRPEIHWDNEHNENGELCDRCAELLKK